MTSRLGILCVSVVLLALAGPSAAALQTGTDPPGPGYVDPQPVLEAAAAAIGTDTLGCVTIAGTATANIVGQQRMHDKNVDWPDGEPLMNYTRIMNWETGTMKEEFDRSPGQNPASWKWGLGWVDGTPTQRNLHQTFAVNGSSAWHIDGANGSPVAASPEDAERWQLDLWLNPHGFLKAAQLPGANPKAVCGAGNLAKWDATGRPPGRRR